MVQLDENDNVIVEFDSITEACNILGVKRAVLGNVCNGRRQQTCDGLRFKYKYDDNQVVVAKTKRKRRKRRKRKKTRESRDRVGNLLELSGVPLGYQRKGL